MKWFYGSYLILLKSVKHLPSMNMPLSSIILYFIFEKSGFLKCNGLFLRPSFWGNFLGGRRPIRPLSPFGSYISCMMMPAQKGIESWAEEYFKGERARAATAQKFLFRTSDGGGGPKHMDAPLLPSRKCKISLLNPPPPTKKKNPAADISFCFFFGTIVTPARPHSFFRFHLSFFWGAEVQKQSVTNASAAFFSALMSALGNKIEAQFKNQDLINGGHENYFVSRMQHSKLRCTVVLKPFLIPKRSKYFKTLRSSN